MATVQSYTKSGVDAKFNSRSNMTMVHNGGGSPDISAYPDSKTGDVIERSSDGARWGVVASTINPIAGRVVSVSGKTGVVTLGPGDVGAAPRSHTHTKAQITDLNATTTATANSIAQRGIGGALNVGTPTATTHATTKAYVDSQVTGGITWSNLTGKPSTFTPSSHTHTVSNITDLTLTAAPTAHTTPIRDAAGRFDVANPISDNHVTNKRYVDGAVSSGTTWANTSGKPSTFPPSAHTHTMANITNLPSVTVAVTNNAIVQRTSAGQIQVPSTPAGNGDAASKSYVDSTVTAGATWSSLAGKPSSFPPSTHTHTKSQISNLNDSATATANSIALRDSGGRLAVATPTTTTHAATKAYVDSAVNSSSSWSAITGKPATFTPSTHTHSYDQITNSPKFDLGYNVVDTEMLPEDFPVGVSYAMSNAETYGWNEAVLSEYPNSTTPGFWMILTARHANFDGSTIQQLYSYDRVGLPIYMRTWNQVLDVWGPFRAITEDGHTHRSSDVRDSTDVLHGNYPSRLLRTRDDGQLYIYTESITSNNHAINKQYVDQLVNTKAATSHTHTSSNITDAVTYASGSTTNGNKLLKTDASGRLTASNPTATNHVANKSYVDSEISAKTTWANTSGKPSTFPPSSHTHTVAQISNLTLSQTATGSSVVQRDSSGRATVATPSATGHATTKAYVDNAITAAKAWSAITGKPSTFTPSTHYHTISQITDLPNVVEVNTAGTVVRRTSSGNINAKLPTAAGHAANKQYVDDLKPWVGTQTQYDAITSKSSSRLYIIT